MNATHFFERRERHDLLPACSESFWTAVFALFLIHLSRSGNRLRVWSCTQAPTKPWYRRHGVIGDLCLPPLTLNQMAIEPRDLTRLLPAESMSLVGISPDVVVSPAGQAGSVLLVENKVTTGASLNHNQVKAYLEFVRSLPTGSLFLVLKSVGCCPDLYAQVRALECSLPDRVGLLLWEDVLQTMSRTGFDIPGLNAQDVARYVGDAAQGDCEGW
jgi:hypothetical protein